MDAESIRRWVSDPERVPERYSRALLAALDVAEAAERCYQTDVYEEWKKEVERKNDALAAFRRAMEEK